MESYLRNLLFLLWEKEKDRNKWPTNLGKILGGEAEDLENILQERIRLSGQQIDRLAEYFNIEKAEFQTVDLLETTNIFKENFCFLLNECSEKKDIRKELGVHPSTISKWKSGKQPPSSTHLRHIKKVFGLDDSIDLNRDPLFLSMEPVSDLGKKQWIKENIDSLSPQGLRELYPALRRLLEERCT